MAVAQKKVDYLTEVTPAVDWAKLYQNTIENWRPIHWDPGPWLAMAPFPIDPEICPTLSRHYNNLRRHEYAKYLKDESKLSSTLQQRYSELSDLGVRTFNEATQETGVERVILHRINCAGGELGWAELHNFEKPDGEKAIHGLTDDARSIAGLINSDDRGTSFSVPDNGCYLATPFIEVGCWREIIVSWSFLRIGGVLEIVIQDETFNFLASKLLDENSPAREETLRIAPTRSNMKVRAVTLLLRGSFTIKTHAIVGIDKLSMV